MKEAPHEAGPKVRSNNICKTISTGLPSPQYALDEPLARRPLALENVRVAFREGSRDG